MTVTWTIEKVLEEYPEELYPEVILPIAPRAGLSGVRHWQIDSPAGRFCLRCWPKHTPILNRLEYTQAVLWHAVYEGIDFVPLPVETVDHKGYVPLFDRYWELLPWLDGESEPLEALFVPGIPVNEALNIRQNPQQEHHPPFPHKSRDLPPNVEYKKIAALRVTAAMIALAQFHEATSTFPLPNEALDFSEAVQQHLEFWKMQPTAPEQLVPDCPASAPHLFSERHHREWMERATEIRSLIGSLRSLLTGLLERVAVQKVPVQPSIGNAHRRHLLYDFEGLSGIIGFKEMGADSVAWDIASLLSSLAGDDETLWNLGLRSYQAIRPLSEEEQEVITALDLTGSLLIGMQYHRLLHAGRNINRPEQVETILDEMAWQNRHLAACRNRLRAA